MKKKSKKRMPPTEEQLRIRRQKALHKKIEVLFSDMGFLSFASEGKTFNLGSRDNEIDHVFTFENVVILCEDTISRDADHVRTKNETMRIIRGNRPGFFAWADANLEGFGTSHKNYALNRLHVFYLYITDGQETFSKDEKQEFSEIHLWGRRELEYFKWLSDCIKHSARYELYASLGLSARSIGPQQGASQPRMIECPIIYPDNFIGPQTHCRVVTFMMSAADMLRMCFVLRKDGWRTQGGLYQRLIDKKKMRTIREFIVAKQSTFYNNIIVSLPKNVQVVKPDGATCSLLDTSSSYEESGLKLQLSDEYNSLCIIDGQHRVYAYHEGGSKDDIVSRLRKERYLLVTGIVFPKNIGEIELLKCQSEIFLDINKNAKPIAADLLLFIKKMQNPLADTSIAQDVLSALNDHGVFRGAFQRSPLDPVGIKTASIIKFALRYLVSVDDDNIGTLYHYWGGDKQRLKRGEPEQLEQYVSYCCTHLSRYFSWVKASFLDQWGAEDSLLPSVVTINGFLIAYRRILARGRLPSDRHFKSRLAKWKQSFARNVFAYRSSQYNRFANDLIAAAFSEGADLNPPAQPTT